MSDKIKNPYLKETPKLKKFVDGSKPLLTRGYGGQENVHRGEGQRVHKPYKPHQSWAGQGPKTFLPTQGDAGWGPKGLTKGEWQAERRASGQMGKGEAARYDHSLKINQIMKEGEASRKKSLLNTKSTTKSKGGGKSGGGGGGKWGWNKLFRRGGSPWSLLRNDKNF